MQRLRAEGMLPKSYCEASTFLKQKLNSNTAACVLRSWISGDGYGTHCRDPASVKANTQKQQQQNLANVKNNQGQNSMEQGRSLLSFAIHVERWAIQTQRYMTVHIPSYTWPDLRIEMEAPSCFSRWTTHFFQPLSWKEEIRRKEGTRLKHPQCLSPNGAGKSSHYCFLKKLEAEQGLAPSPFQKGRQCIPFVVVAVVVSLVHVCIYIKVTKRQPKVHNQRILNTPQVLRLSLSATPEHWAPSAVSLHSPSSSRATANPDLLSSLRSHLS